MSLHTFGIYSMEGLVETPRGKSGCDLCAALDVPTQLPVLNATQRALLLRWARKDANTRSSSTLLKEAKAIDISIEQAEQFCGKLLREGWISLQLETVGGNRLWDALTWRDLPLLQGMLELTSASQRLQARHQKIVDMRTWLQAWRDNAIAAAIDPDLLDELTHAIDHLAQDKSLRPKLLDTRLGLLKALADWHDRAEQGLRRNFELKARGATKAISVADWRWLESLVDLERIGIARFAQVAWLAGDIALSWQGRTLELAPLLFVGVPLENLQHLESMRAPHRWWLIENRASFEQQARHLEPGVALLWMPGRPSHAWLDALSRLLAQAPAPAWISADADPAGVDIACTVGALWELAGLVWEPYLMGLPQWEATSQYWPLNEHDRRLLASLLLRDTLAPALRALCKAMLVDGRKAEQEAWL